ncbi:hypothetical protein [Microbacterium sediminis]|nr:hypothetical protein [Microbacterium sediminis]
MSAPAEVVRMGLTPTDELYPPVQYGGLWLLLAAGILIVIVGVIALIVLLTRPPKPRAERTEPERPTAERLQRLRSDYLQRIDAVERAYGEGHITARRANAELSRLTRAFVNDYTGLATPVMSLDELEAHDVHPALVDALRRHYYPSLFRGGPVIDPAAGASAAREVVNAWH